MFFSFLYLANQPTFKGQLAFRSRVVDSSPNNRSGAYFDYEINTKFRSSDQLTNSCWSPITTYLSTTLCHFVCLSLCRSCQGMQTKWATKVLQVKGFLCFSLARRPSTSCDYWRFFFVCFERLMSKSKACNFIVGDFQSEFGIVWIPSRNFDLRVACRLQPVLWTNYRKVVVGWLMFRTLCWNFGAGAVTCCVLGGLLLQDKCSALSASLDFFGHRASCFGVRGGSSSCG